MLTFLAGVAAGLLAVLVDRMVRWKGWLGFTWGSGKRAHQRASGRLCDSQWYPTVRVLRAIERGKPIPGWKLVPSSPSPKAVRP